MTNLALTLLKLAALVLPLGLPAWRWRIFPRAPLAWLALGAAAVTLGVPFFARAVYVVAAVDAVVVALAMLDLVSLPRQRAFSVERTALRIASLRKPHPVTLTILNLGTRRRAVDVRDGVPHELHGEPAEFAFRLERRSRATLNYVLRPSRRGAFRLDQVHLRVRSRFGFWQRLLNYPLATTIHVYPDMKQLGQYALLARTNRLSLLGVRRTRRIGQDHDFERLRDYGVDDNYRHIDWRATARRQKLTVRDYQASQSQRILFLIDCGRMMTNQCAGLSLLDHALNSMLMLSYVALRQGDAAGMVTFSDEIHSYIPPRAGMRQMDRLLHASFDRFPQLVESRYDLAFRYLAAHCRRRTLVVLMTNVIDEVNAHQVEQYLTNLVGRHLPLGVVLRDRRLFEAHDGQPTDHDGLWRAAAAADILAWRHRTLGDLQRKGVLLLDVFPDHLTAPLVNRYLEIKARHLL